MAEPNQVTITIHAPLPADEAVAGILFGHLRDLAIECEQAGWESTIVLTMGKPKE